LNRYSEAAACCQVAASEIKDSVGARRIHIEIIAYALAANGPDFEYLNAPKSHPRADQVEDWKLALGGGIIVRRG
jgi:hypothetical protein